MIIEYIKAVIYGIVEGITEWLPVSSTGHLILLEQFLKFDSAILGAELAEQFSAMFDVVVQLGAIFAVLAVYFKRLFPFGKNKRQTWSLWGKLTLATLPAAIIGLLADKMCERYSGVSLDTLLFNPSVVASALIVYGILFILVEKLAPKNELQEREISCRSALAIGFFQALAIIPGTSRSGATILGARILGIPRKSAAEFSFFAAIPVIAAASLLKIVDFGSYCAESSTKIPAQALIILCIAGAVAFLVSLATLKFLTDFVKKHSFIPFGIYRIILGIFVLIFFKH